MIQHLLRYRNRIGISIAFIFGTLVLSWPAFINGSGFYFPDTTAYIRSADAAVAQMTGQTSIWSDRLELYKPIQSSTAGPEFQSGRGGRLSTGLAAPKTTHPILLGRSIYYGLAIYPFVILIGDVGVVLFHAMLVVVCFYLAFVGLGGPRKASIAWLFGSVSLLSVVTPVAYGTSLLMPDILSGCAGILGIVAIVGWHRLLAIERIALTCILVFSALSHNSHILLLLVLLAAILPASRYFKGGYKPAVLLLTFAIFSGFAGDALFSAAISQKLGVRPIRPPFLTARLLDAGPGIAMLDSQCGLQKFEACQFRDRMPQDSDTFLWSKDKRAGVFAAESHAVQRRLSLEDTAFAVATLSYDPIGTFVVTAFASLRQVTMVKMDLFNAPFGGNSEDATAGLPRSVREQIINSRYVTRTMPVAIVEAFSLIFVVTAAFYLMIVVIWGRSNVDKLERNFRLAALLAILLIIANATITGALSKPHNRYNIRIVWIVPLFALVIPSVRYSRRRYPIHTVQTSLA